MQNYIFDLDGTLVDSAKSVIMAIDATLVEFGYKVDSRLSADLIGPPLLQTLKNITGENSDEILTKLVKFFIKKYDSKFCIESHPYIGMEELLQSLKSRDKNLLVATNKRLIPTRRILNFLGWEKYFTHIYCIDSKAPSFPDKAAMIANLMRENKLLQKETIYIGDRAEDYIAAIKNNIIFGYVQWGYGKNQVHTTYMYNFSMPEEIGMAF